jgi:hypothetical protein
MSTIDETLADMEAYVDKHAEGWGSKDAARDHLSQHALCYSATQYLPASSRRCEYSWAARLRT